MAVLSPHLIGGNPATFPRRRRSTHGLSDPDLQVCIGGTHAARMTQLDGASQVMGLHLKHSNSIIQLLGH